MEIREKGVAALARPVSLSLALANFFPLNGPKDKP